MATEANEANFRLAILCFSLNSDLRLYFESKIEVLGDRFGDDLVFVGHQSLDAEPAVLPFSSARSAFFDVRILLDALRTPALVWRLKRMGVGGLLFDTAHLSNVPVAMFARLFGLQVVFTIHDWVPHPGKKSIFVRAYNRFAEAIGRSLVMFSAPYPQPDREYSVLPLCGLHDQVRHPRVSGDGDGKTWLFFGRIDVYKGVEFLPEIAERLGQRRPHDTIIVAGAGYHPGLRLLSSLPNVDVVNRFIDSDEVVDLFARAHALLLPYTSATQSGVVPLGLGFGRPAIAFDVGCLRDYIDPTRTGSVVPANDTDAFVKAMISFAKVDTQLSEPACLARFEELHSVQAMRVNYGRLIARLIGRGDPAPRRR